MRRSSGLMLVLLIALGCAQAVTPTPTPTPPATGQPSPTPAATDDPTGSPAPSGAPTPTPGPTEIGSAAHAAAVVLASNDLFASVAPLNIELIGQCCWYEAAEADSNFLVTVVLGWGDCLAGCTEQHRWHYRVEPDGVIVLRGEEGDEPVPAPPPPNAIPASIIISLVAGPTCPVVTDPPDPACRPRPVPDANVVIRDHNGHAIDRRTSGADGLLRLQVPPGVYVLEPQPVAGLMGTAAPAAVSVRGDDLAELVFEYDTGIR